MPRGNRTGPMGMGPMTGHRGGYCAGYNMPGFMNPGPGIGFGAGYGGGRGRGWRWWPRFYETGSPGWAIYDYAPNWFVPPTQEQEAESLKRQAEWLKGQLDEINQRIEKLKEE
jgi:hypothetical protein